MLRTRISFERGVPSAAAQLVGGGLGVTAQPYTVQWWVGWTLFAFGFLLLIWGIRWSGKPWWQAIRKTGGLPLYIECHMGRLPSVLRGDGSLKTFSLVAMGDTPSISSGFRPYSDGEKLDWGQEPPPHGTRVTVTNHSERPLVGVVLKGELIVRECEKPKPGLSRSGKEIAKLDVTLPLDRILPGESGAVTIYVYNQSPHFGTLSLTEAHGAPIGEKSSKIAVETNWMGRQISLFPDARFEK